MLGVVVSRADEASTAIGAELHHLTDAEPVGVTDAAAGWRADGLAVREFEDRHLDLVCPAAAFPEVDVLVFASKHAGETGKLLTAHHTGNFGPADHGGEPNALARAAPNAHAAVVDALTAQAPPDYEVGIECTHHGPTDVGAPSLFVEVGSAPDQWADEHAARAVARAIHSLRGEPADRKPEGETEMRRQLVGFGGGHYAPRFLRVARETDWAVGHVAADWGLEALGNPTAPAARQVIRDCFTESAADVALVAGDRPDLRSVIADLGYRVVGETWVRETDGVPLPVVVTVEDRLGRVEDGVRFGARAPERPESVVLSTLPTALLETACGIDLERTRTVIAGSTVAYTTTDGGSKPTDRVALVEDGGRWDIVDDLADVLRTRYDVVERAEDEIVARETVFDPDLAATLGVPEGPKFGQLADGEPVEVDGCEVPPSAVETERERRFTVR